MGILLDMDGVVADYVSAIHDHHGKINIYNDPINLGVYSHLLPFNMTWEEYNKGLDYDFWFSLDKTPEADQIVELARSYDQEIMFITHPIGEFGCYEGKLDWAHKHFPGIPVYFAPDGRSSLAKSNYILIDDSDKNVFEYSNNRGRAVLVPRKWNSDHIWSDSVMERIMEVLKRQLRFS